MFNITKDALLETSERHNSLDAAHKFISALDLNKFKSEEYFNENNYWFLTHSYFDPIYTDIHIIKDEICIHKSTCQIRIYNDERYSTTVIGIQNNHLAEIAGRYMFGTSYYLMEFNDIYNTLEFYINKGHTKTKVIIFPHFSTE